MQYAADVTPQRAFEVLQERDDAVLVDVRTAAEWAYVGGPDVSSLGRTTLQVEWLRFPDGVVNRAFLDELAAAGVSKQAPVLFLCRSGVRSVAAAEAAAAAGYAAAFNVLDGFEGPHDGQGHRGRVAGWKAVGLPWRQP